MLETFAVREFLILLYLFLTGMEVSGHAGLQFSVFMNPPSFSFSRVNRFRLVCVFCGTLVSGLCLYADDVLPEEAASLKESYGREVKRVLSPVQEKYIDGLERLQDSYTRSGKLDDALKIKQEIELAKQWKTIPVGILRGEEMENLSRNEFEEWLLKKEFSFKGVSSVTLRFGEEYVDWDTGSKFQRYEYKVSGSREVTIFGSQEFKLEFEKDLSGGFFISNIGKYDLTIADAR